MVASSFYQLYGCHGAALASRCACLLSDKSGEKKLFFQSWILMGKQMTNLKSSSWYWWRCFSDNTITTPSIFLSHIQFKIGWTCWSYENRNFMSWTFVETLTHCSRHRWGPSEHHNLYPLVWTELLSSCSYILLHQTFHCYHQTQSGLTYWKECHQNIVRGHPHCRSCS